MRFAVAMIIVGLLAWAAPAAADEVILHYGDNPPTEYGNPGEYAFWIDYTTPDEWIDTVCSEVRFFARGYGDNSKTLGSLVLYGPAEDETTLFETEEGRHQILTRKVFDLKDVPADGGWMTIGFDPVKLPAEFAVVIYSYSTEDRGIEIGLTEPNTDAKGKSGYFYIEKVRNVEARETTTGDRALFFDNDHHWMIQAVTANTLPPVEAISVADISGAGYVYYDDGEADGFITSQRHGPMVKFDAGGTRTVDRVYVYGQLDGAWFQTEKLATAYLLDEDYRIISREVLRYDRFVNEPCWGAIDYKDVRVTGEYYVLIEPLAKLDVELMLGFDSSGENIGSLWGTAGAIGSWDTTAPEELTNWMIRVHYK